MITPEDIVKAIRDSISMEPPEHGGGYYCHGQFNLEIEATDQIILLGDSFYGFPFDINLLRENFAKLGVAI